jgi:hypothetical protein
MQKEVDVIKELDNASKQALTELEETKLENFVLKHGILQQQLQRIVADRTAFIKQIEDAHPGFRWDDTQGSLVALPATNAVEENTPK